MDMEEAKSFLESNFKIIQGVINKACRKYNLDGGDADEFSSIVYEKLLDDDYKKIRSFVGSSSFNTYITAVISHIFIDTIIRPVKGRWKASKKALALGREAIELEELVLKNGYNIDQAIETLVGNPDYSISKDDAYKMASKLELQKKYTFCHFPGVIILYDFQKKSTLSAFRPCDSHFIKVGEAVLFSIFISRIT